MPADRPFNRSDRYREMEKELDTLSALLAGVEQERNALARRAESLRGERDRLRDSASALLIFMYGTRLPVDEPKSQMIELANALHFAVAPPGTGDDPGTVRTEGSPHASEDYDALALRFHRLKAENAELRAALTEERRAHEGTRRLLAAALGTEADDG